MNLIEMKQKDIRVLKERLHERNNGYCPLLDMPVDLDKMALDHIHKLKSEAPSEQKGTVRNAIEFRANAMEGKITNNWKRYFGADEDKHPISLSEYLRNLADYLEAGSYCDDDKNYYIHPTEVVKLPPVSKSKYNRLKRAYTGRAKFPEYPKSKKLTKRLESLFEEYEIYPYNSPIV